MNYDVFNGDADGICALIQLRLAEPREAELVTGVKRAIELLANVFTVPDDAVTVLDISLAKNLAHLQRLLREGAKVLYVDHHQAGEIPPHPNLTACIDTSAHICTSLLVDQYLQGRHRAWAVTGAFGDNLQDAATCAAATLGWSAGQLQQVQDLGICINYNGYGDSIADLHFAPASLYQELVNYGSPLEFIQDQQAIYQQLLAGYQDDLHRALQINPEFATDAVAVYRLPDAAWARRVSGVFGNELATRYPQRAHAVLTDNALGGLQVSVRAPLNNKTGADELCGSFPSGGGRKAAAGINHLPLEQLPAFIAAFAEKYS